MAKVKVTIDPKFAASVAKDKQAVEKAAKQETRREFDGPDGRYIGKLTVISAKPDKNGAMGVSLNWTLTKDNQDYVGSPLNSYFGLCDKKIVKPGPDKGKVWQTKEESYAELFNAMKLCGVPEKMLVAAKLGDALKKLAELDPTAKLSVKTKNGYQNVFVNGLFEDGGEEEETAHDGDGGEEDEATTDDESESAEDTTDDETTDEDESTDEAEEGGEEEATTDDDDSTDGDDDPVVPTKGDKFMYIVKGKNKGKPTPHEVTGVNRARSFCTLQGAYGIQKLVPFDKLGDLCNDDD